MADIHINDLNFTKATWVNTPRMHKIAANRVVIKTEPNTDFWQRSYYGFRNDNAPCLLLKSSKNFTFTVKVSFDYKELYDQCGVIIYQDSNNWFKASIEYENQYFSRLGSVVTNVGIYACSPLESLFDATFSDMTLDECKWLAHGEQ